MFKAMNNIHSTSPKAIFLDNGDGLFFTREKIYPFSKAAKK